MSHTFVLGCIMKDAVELHYVNCRIQCLWSLTDTREWKKAFISPAALILTFFQSVS